MSQPADGNHKIGSMSAAHSKERSPDGSSQTGGKGMKRSGSKVTPEVSLPPLCPGPARLSAASVVRPPLSQVTSDRPPSVVELPQIMSQVGPGRPIVNIKWSEGPQLMASALGTDIPIRESQLSVREEDKSKTATARKKKNTLKSPLTGIEVVEFFGQDRRLEDVELYYLKEADRDARRPYDLRVVNSSDAGSEHYIFSPTTVLHMTEAGYGGLVSVAEWHREFEKWTALQEISLFRNCRLQKAFTRWHKNTRSISFQRKCKNLQGMLLVAVPRFRRALHRFTGVIEELKGTHWIPLDGCKTYTLLDLRKLLTTRNQEHLQILKKLSQCRTTILNTVKDESYSTHQELQLHMTRAKNPNRSVEPIHLLLAHQQELQKELARSEGVLQKLGKFAALIHQMVVQSLVTVVQQDASSFLNLVERMKSQQCCVFRTELCFTASNEVTVNPPVRLFQEGVSEALLSAGSSLIQMCESCGFFLEISSSDLCSPKDFTCDSGSCVKRAEITEEKSDDGKRGRLLRNKSAHWVLLPKETLPTVQGNRVRGCYAPLSKTQLEWHVSINDATKRAENEQARITQEAEVEIQQLCETFGWLVDIQLLVSRWSGASLEAMKGQPASLYEEHIRKVRDWAERISKVDSALSTTNQLFTINCNHMKESLGQQLRVIDEDVLEHLTEQIQLHSADFISDLQKTSVDLNAEPQDLRDFSQYATKVRESGKMLPDTQKRLEYIHSLSDTVCMNYRKMTEQELALREKMLGLWDCFIPLLKQADSRVRHRLPSATNTLDARHSDSVCDIKNEASDGMSKPFLDSRQDAEEILSEQNDMCAHLHRASTKLEQHNSSSPDMPERPLDLTVLTKDDLNVVARKELWAAMAGHSKWLEERKQLPLSEVFQDLCRGWENRLFQMEEFALPAWQPCENQSGLRENEKTTEGTFSNSPPVCQNSCNDARVTVIGLEILFAEIESDLMTLSTMLKSPHSVDFRLQLKHLIQSLQELEKLLDVFQRYHQMWGFMSKVFSETSFSDEREDLMQLFLQVDETFKEIMQTISSDPHVLNFVSTETKGRFHGSSLRHILLDGLSTMETVSNQMTDVLDAICHQYPRFWFLRDRNVIELLSFHSTSLALQRFVRKCFQGVEWLEVQSNASNMETSEATSENQKQSKVLGIFGSLQEHISFSNPLEPNPDAILWFSAFEKQLKLTMIQFMERCVVHEQLEQSNHDPTSDKAKKGNPPCVDDTSRKIQTMLATLSDFPLQCVLVAEEAAWGRAVVQAFQKSNPLRLSHMKALNAAKLKELGRTIRDGLTGFKSESLASKYRMTCLWALVHLTMNHSQQLSRLTKVQIPLESSFEWLSLIKYSVHSEDVSQEDSAHTTCYIDVLDHRFQYGFEYFGPEDLVIACTPSTDQAMLGILLALANFRCGFVSGPRKSGKKTTAFHLGKALGRQIVVAQCCPSMTLSVIQNLLLGSLQTGAYLYLDSVELLTQGILSILGQHLLDIHQFFAKLRSNLHQSMNDKPKDKTGHSVEDLEYHMEFAGKSFSASPSYGCILTSSQWYSSNIPDSLRFATRPIAFKYPDHRIIAEVMLTSLGFSDAMSLSHRLVSLLSLARDSHSLPEFFSAGQNGFLVILQKIISASKIHLYQTMQKRERSNEACFTADTSLFSQVVPENLKEAGKKENEKLSKLRKSHLSVVQDLLEETAIVKAILSVLIPEHSKASQFSTIFKETFPIVCQFPYQHSIEEMEKNQLQDAVREELQQKQFYNDSDIISSTVTLYQAMKVSQAVILVGPSGSGKTTCYSALAGALNSLAAKSRRDAFENDKTIAKKGQQICASSWSFVNSSVLFPNAMSHEELFGRFCQKRGWRDGAVAKVLRERHDHTHPQTNITEMGSQDTSLVKWLVMDGEPSGQPSWLDYLTTLYSNQAPCLRLPSGETVALSQSNFKLLIETTDLDCATPSSVTCCSLVIFPCVDLWKAVWESEMDALSFEHNLDQGVKRMWNCLAEDLFHSTLSLAIQKDFTSAIQTEGKYCRNPVRGIQEVMSFGRILRALLLHFRKEVEEPEEIPQMDKQGVHLHGAKTPGSKNQSKQQLITRDVFLVAYIWGFGGHLHPCHWKKFDTLARNVLFACRYKIVVPENVSVFDHFFSIDTKMHPKNTMVTSSIIPKYEKYTFLMNVMLEANQPVLLVGEPSSGKSTLCKNLLKFDKPHVSLPASPLLSSRDIRIVLKTISHQKRCKDTVRSMEKKPCLLLFVDDLHEAPCDVFGKESIALETLRQSISKRETATFDTDDFELLSSETVSYMATCCASGLSNRHSNVMSSRLSRLFSIFVLPDPDVVLPIQPNFKVWLKEIQPMHSVEDMSDCIVSATKGLYYAVRDRLQYPTQQSHFSFSHHDIQKVLWGMCLHQFDNSNRGSIPKKENSQSSTRPPLSVLKIVHLWIHECMRTFTDRLCSEHDMQSVVSLIATTTTTHFKEKIVAEIESEIIGDSPTVAGPALHTLPPDAAFNYQPTGQDSNIQNLSQWPNLAGQFVQSVLWSAHTMTQPSHLSQTIYSEETCSESQSLPAQVDEHVKNVITRLVYGPKLSEARDYGCSWSYPEQDLDALVQELCAVMDKKEDDEALRVHNDHSITSSYIVHRQGATQLLHILRALLIPGGHGVLMGSSPGTGRKTTVRSAAYLTGYRLIEVHSGNENQLHEILQDAGKQIRVDKVKVIILVHEEISKPVREELLVAMSQRAYPALHPDNELRNLVSRAAVANNSRRCRMRSWISDTHLHQVHRNIHVFLLLPFTMTDSNETSNYKSQPSTLQAQMAKAVKLSCCVEVYQPWSHQCLVEVALQCFKKQHYIKVREDSKSSLSVVMAGIHQSACQYASVLLKYQPFSPSTYVGLIAQFGSLCNLLQQPRQRKSDRVATILCHLDALKDAAERSKADVTTLQNRINVIQQHEKETLRVIGHQNKMYEEARTKSVELTKKLNLLKEEIAKLETMLNPVVMSRFLIPQCLNLSDLEEVRHYRDPPEGVVETMDAICLLFNRPPGWESARHLLGQPSFFQDLLFFDQYSVTEEQLQQLKQILCSPHFLFIPDISKACESLCQWIRAVYQSCCMRQQHLLKQHLEAQAGETERNLSVARRREKEATDGLKAANLQLQSVKKDLEEQTSQLQKAESIKEELYTSAKQAEMHHKAWKATAQEAELHNLSLAGDALILAAIISYSGPFGPDIRQELLSKWKKLCYTGIIDINPEDPRTSLFENSNTTPLSPLFGFPIPVTERLQLPLGQALGMGEWQTEDTLSARLLVKLLLWGYRGAFVQRWPLLANTQQHLERRSKNWLLTGENAKLDEETESEMIVCVDDPELLDKLGQASQRGLRVLVTHVERAIPSLDFLAILARPAGCIFPDLKEPPLKALPEFSLILSTDLPVKLLLREIHPSILAQVHVVDLSLSSEEIQELMLTQLLQSDCANLLTQHSRLLNYNQLLQEKLFAEEEALMDYILQCDTVLHENTAFVPRVAVCQEAMEKLHDDVKQLKEELKDLESLLAAPRHLMRLATSLYQALQEVSRLSPAYDFSLSDFIEMILKAFTGQSKSLVLYASRNKTGGLVSRIGNMMAVRVLVQYRPCLFQSHAAVLKLLVSLALLKHNECCSEAEALAFLRGLEDVEGLITEERQRPQLNPDLPSWISPQTYSELLCLEKIPAFRGLLASLSASPMLWQEYLRFPSSTVVGTVPCHSHSHLSLLQRALLWKTILPNCLEGIADDLNDCVLCPFGRTGAEAPHVGNPDSLSQYLLKHVGPIILALPDPKGGQQISIHPLRLIHQLSQFAEVGVKSITFGELCDSKLIFSLLEKAVNDGHWLIFNNCHLLERWDEQVVAELCRLVSFSKEEKHLIHPQFRLWFITQTTATQSIPVAVRLCALSLACDSAWDLNEELSFSLRQLLSVSQPLGVTDENTELLLRCAIFHSVLLQRQAYKYTHQDRIYYWSEEDLLALIDSHRSIASLCHDKAKVLQSIAVSLVYGSHVIDSADSQMVESVAEICFNRELSLSGIRQHLLSDMINLSELSQILHQSLKESGVTDPVLLGFGGDVSAEISRIKSHNLNTLLQASQSPLGTRFSARLNQPETAAALSYAGNKLQALKSYLAHRTGCPDTDAEAISHSPLRDFLQAEWDDLIDLVSSLLSQPVQYTPTFSSLLNLTELSRLERRAELLSAYLWHHGTSDPPGAYRMSAFKNAGSFLVAVMRQAAQVNRKYISDITLHFEVQDDSTCPASLPLNAVYLCGLELKGASWDPRIGALQDTIAIQSCSLPLLCIKAEIRNTARDALSCKSLYLLDPCNVQAESTLSSPRLPVYHCPLYVSEEQDGGNGGLVDDSIVTKVPLCTKLSPALCNLRRVRLVSTL